jgi:DNA-binding MarR family transcriptional regulator
MKEMRSEVTTKEERGASSETYGEEAPEWLESILPRIMRRLMDSENLDMPLLQLPLAQMRLAQALYHPDDSADLLMAGETMGRLSEQLGVRHNALTQAADRLVNHGLAERLSDPQDRRIVRLRLTAKGRDWVAQRRARRKAHLGTLWEVLTSEERTEFLRAVCVLESIVKRLDHPLEASQASEAQTSHTVEETLSRFTVGAANGASAKIEK